MLTYSNMRNAMWKGEVLMFYKNLQCTVMEGTMLVENNVI